MLAPTRSISDERHEEASSTEELRRLPPPPPARCKQTQLRNMLALGDLAKPGQALTYGRAVDYDDDDDVDEDEDEDEDEHEDFGAHLLSSASGTACLP
ncbi:hypothetical protein AWZ03_002381 [Drosophila navojoa]|uniref:Uncharacterized protein n=1 Tax=Drosophila navojoa TaxID=7232 RepID=A0A484BRK3_DRONA|nr:hypothetical protein AWZ03_002381 [Drosophila navojoa]